MILTCPECATRYAVKEGAIPPGGRQVRCASCKHSWHQNPEGEEATALGGGDDQAFVSSAADEATPQSPLAQATGGDAHPIEAPAADHAHPDVSAETVVASEDADSHPLPEPGAAEPVSTSEPHPFPDPEPQPPLMHEALEDQPVAQEPFSAPEPEPVLAEPAYAAQPEPVDTGWNATEQHHEVDFPAYVSADEEEPRRRGLVGLLLALLLIAGAVAAFWFLAPPEWKQRLGVAESGATPLVVQLDETNRRTLASGNELLEVTGKVINPTDQPQRVPQIEAMLRSYEQKVVYRWTIPPPAPTLAPGGSATFNSAELLTVPADARCLSVSAIDGGAKQLEPCTPQSQQVATQAG